MAKESAGILLFRRINGELEFFLVHPGGPFWKKKDEGAWSIPKGEVDEGDNPLATARREFKEETGFAIKGDLLELIPVRLKSGKRVYGWAQERDVDAAKIKSNDFEIEWPPRSGKMQRFPEVDRAGWFGADEALLKINAAQAGFIREVETLLKDK
jgi:predicted NUDIX family NTP pyrophosphohydrolase